MLLRFAATAVILVSSTNIFALSSNPDDNNYLRRNEDDLAVHRDLAGTEFALEQHIDQRRRQQDGGNTRSYQHPQQRRVLSKHCRS